MFIGTVSQLARDPEKPTLSTEARISEASIGGTAMLEAKVLGFPKPDVRWFHDGNEVKATGRLKFLFEDQESVTLVIKNVTAEDAGVYKIVAKNDLGEDTTELELTVKCIIYPKPFTISYSLFYFSCSEIQEKIH